MQSRSSSRPSLSGLPTNRDRAKGARCSRHVWRKRELCDAHWLSDQHACLRRGQLQVQRLREDRTANEHRRWTGVMLRDLSLLWYVRPHAARISPSRPASTKLPDIPGVASAFDAKLKCPQPKDSLVSPQVGSGWAASGSCPGPALNAREPACDHQRGDRCILNMRAVARAGYFHIVGTSRQLR